MSNRLSENYKQLVLSNFFDLFNKKFPNYLSQIEQRFDKSDFFTYHSLDPNEYASAHGDSVYLSDSFDFQDSYTRYILYHELYHVLSHKFEFIEDDISNFYSTYAISSHYPDSYLKKFLILDNAEKGITSFDLDYELERLHKTSSLLSFYTFEEACTEFLNSYMASFPKDSALSFDSSSLYILSDKFKSGYDFNVSLIDMLSNLVDPEQILEMQLGNIAIGDFFTSLDEEYSDCIESPNDEFPGFELLRCLCDLKNSRYHDVRGDLDNYICASTFIIRAFHKKITSSNISSIDDLTDLYNRIKNMQSCMAFDFFNNYADRPDVLEMESVQADFIDMLSKFPNTNQISAMKENIDFRTWIPFNDNDISALQTIYNSKNYPISEKNVIGKYIVPKNSSDDCRNNLYSILERISNLSGDVGIASAYLNKSLRIPELAESISKLPSDISSLDDVLQYKKIEDTLALLTTSTLMSRYDARKSEYFFESFNKVITTIQSHSILDSEFGKSQELKRLEKVYSDRLSDYINTVENDAMSIKNPKALPPIREQIKRLKKLKLSSDKLPDDI